MTNPSVYPRGYRPRHAADGPDSTPVVARRQADWRPEIQGLRAVAVLLVVVFHIFTDRVSGGVDIFLFISAFFLTGSFTRKMEAGRPLAVGRYWLHVFTRLMPMAVLTILLTLVAVATVYPLADRASWRTEALASALYVENWALAFNAVDYYAADNTSLSPFQHFWSLSVQGQVFILWPLLFLVSALVARRTGARPRAVLTTAFASVFVVSLLWSVTQTSQNQAFTYFDTRARLWEFALGSLLALVLPFIHLGRRTRVFLGWAGLASMIAVGVVLMAGNSHVMPWSPALRRLGEERRLEVVSYTRGSCLVAPMEEQVDDSPKCPDFLADLNLVVEHVRPDVVFMQGTRSTYEDEEMLTPGMVGRMEEIAGTGAHVLALRDNPRFAAGSPTTCGRTHGIDAATCRWTHTVLDPNTSPLTGLADAHPRIAQVQLNDMICPGRQCQPTVGNVHVYWDDNHLTPTYVETLAPVFIERALAALEHDGMRLGR